MSEEYSKSNLKKN